MLKVRLSRVEGHHLLSNSTFVDDLVNEIIAVLSYARILEHCPTKIVINLLFETLLKIIDIITEFLLLQCQYNFSKSSFIGTLILIQVPSVILFALFEILEVFYVHFHTFMGQNCTKRCS